MSREHIKQIKVNRRSVGIVGLEAAMADMPEEYAERPDHEIGSGLFKRLSRKNYIPDRLRPDYTKAFLREFKKSLGKPYEEEVSEALDIKVLGPGCVQCGRLERELMEVMAEMNLSADLDHVTDIKEIGRYGIMGTPALIINGKVMSVGRVPPKGKIKEWLSEFV